MVNGEPVSRGLSYVVRKSAQIKSAETITYDDNGEVIPLSERFKADNDDIRYSLRDRLEREELADRFDRIAETDAEREIVEKYKAEIEIADDAIDERRRVIKRLDEIEGKAGFGDERKRLRSELEHWNSVITGHDSRLFELEGFKPFRDMVERYEQALRERHARGGSDRFDESHMWISQAKYRELINRSRGEKFYIDTDAEKVSIIAVYRVLKRGIKIGEHGNHKLRGKHTITFAAPVELNGVRGNMAVVVNMRNNRYKVHRILMPDGSGFTYENKKDVEPTGSGITRSNASKGSDIGSTSTTIIPDSETKSNPSEEKSAKKILEGKYSLSDREGREALAEAFYGMAETDAEREIVTKYRAEIDNIDAKIAERGELIRQFEELEGKSGVIAERTRLNERIRSVTEYITRRDTRLFELEAMKPFRDKARSNGGENSFNRGNTASY